MKREVDSLGEAFIEDLSAEVAELPSIAERLEKRDFGGKSLPPHEAAALQSKIVWLYLRWIASLAAEIDRLDDHVDELNGEVAWLTERVNKRPRNRRAPRRPRRPN